MTRKCSHSAGSNRKRLLIILGSLGVIALCVAIRCYWGAENASAQTNSRPAASRDHARVERGDAEDDSSSAAAGPSSPSAKPIAGAIVATVNNQRITREELNQECRKLFGVEVLESMVNKQLIVQECKRVGVDVSSKDVDAEIGRMAKRFNLPVDQWLKLLKEERNVSADQYSNDIVWPKLALRKIAGEKLSISHEELVKQYEIEYGESVRVRLIAVSSLEKAKKLHSQAVANPADFGNLAKDFSEDAPSASVKGVINPIRKHGSYQEIEDAVFNMADGEISPVIHAGGQYVILRRDGLNAAQEVSFEQVAPRLEESLRDQKLASVAKDIFQRLQENAKVVNVWNDPVKHGEMPNVAATINGEPIMIRELDEECVARRGLETLDGMINRKLLEQACKRRNIAIGDEDMDAEIARAALANVKPKSDGSPDVQAWLDLIKNKQNMTIEA
jgi:parvulin-like peptidyl-prolyl isomerase